MTKIRGLAEIAHQEVLRVQVEVNIGYFVHLTPDPPLKEPWSQVRPRDCGQ